MKPRALCIEGGRIIDPSQSLDLVASLLLVDGKVAALGPTVAVPPDARRLNASGLVVTPGWMDIHTHLRDPGEPHKEDIASGTRAAAAGGFTAIACMANTNPVHDTAFITRYIQQKVAACSAITVYPIGAVSRGLEGRELAEIGSMWEAGIVGISDDGRSVMSSYLMRKAMDYSVRFGLVVISHAEDENLKGRGVMNEGFNSARFGLRGNPKTAEELAVARDILLAELTGAKLHIAHVSSRGSVELIRWAKQRGVRVTCEVTPHHLLLTDDMVQTYDTNTKVAPPLREPADTQALQEALADGTIDIVASDHAPHSEQDKQVEFDQAAFGMVGLETAFALYHRLCLAGRLSLPRLVEAMTTGPAGVIGVRKGTLAPGSDGDVTVFCPKTPWKIDPSRFRSRSRNTPFAGWEVQGQVCYTVVGAQVVFERESGRPPADTHER